MNTRVSQSGVPPLSELLVADADPTSVELCRQLTGASGLTVRTTHDSETTLDGLESGLVDVLLLSEQLPGGSDLEFLRHIRYWYPETQGHHDFGSSELCFGSSSDQTGCV
jgi:CheY-like chemotaxis protein